MTVDCSNKIRGKGKQLFIKSKSILFTKESTSQGTVSESSPTQIVWHKKSLKKKVSQIGTRTLDMFIDGGSSGPFTFIKVSVHFQFSEQTFAQWAARYWAFLLTTKKKICVVFPQILLSHLTEVKDLYQVFNLNCYCFIDRHQFLNSEVFVVSTS